MRGCFQTLALLILISQSACTTLSRDFIQVIRVDSAVPGAKVVVEGKLVGVTPGYFEVSRGYSPKVVVGDREVSVPTAYRWSRSFWSGLVFSFYAPVGWLMDISTGTAWDLEDISVGTLNAANRPAKSTQAISTQTIAIAPPRAESVEVSDNAGASCTRP
jgi:hypothetical protein